MPNNEQKLKMANVLTFTALAKLGLLRTQNRVRRWSVRPINKCRRQFGRFLNAFKVMQAEDAEEFYKYTRLYLEEFNTLVKMLEPNLTKRSCVNTISTKERLAMTLR